MFLKFSFYLSAALGVVFFWTPPVWSLSCDVPGLDQDLVDPLLDILQVATKDLASDGMKRWVLVGWNWRTQAGLEIRFKMI